MKKFQDYLEKRLTKQEVADIERKAKLELRVLRVLFWCKKITKKRSICL